MSRARCICGRCGSVVVEGGAVVELGPAPAGLGSATLCDDCRDLLVEWLGPRAFRGPETPRKAVVDHGRFETR